MAVRIIADGSCDISAGECARLDIIKIPLQVFFGDECFVEGENLTAQEFYARLSCRKRRRFLPDGLKRRMLPWWKRATRSWCCRFPRSSAAPTIRPAWRGRPSRTPRFTWPTPGTSPSRLGFWYMKPAVCGMRGCLPGKFTSGSKPTWRRACGCTR